MSEVPLYLQKRARPTWHRTRLSKIYTTNRPLSGRITEFWAEVDFWWWRQVQGDLSRELQARQSQTAHLKERVRPTWHRTRISEICTTSRPLSGRITEFWAEVDFWWWRQVQRDLSRELQARQSQTAHLKRRVRPTWHRTRISEICTTSRPLSGRSQKSWAEVDFWWWRQVQGDLSRELQELQALQSRIAYLKNLLQQVLHTEVPRNRLIRWRASYEGHSVVGCGVKGVGCRVL